MHSLRLNLCTLLIGVWLGQAAKLHNEMTADELARLLGSKSLDEIPDYDLVTPFQVDEHGSFHSNDLSTIHLRTRRSDYHLVKDVPAHFKVPAFGDVHHLAVSPNNELLSPGFILQVHLDNGKIDTHYEYTHSQYVGTVRGDEDSHVAISNHGGNLMGVIITANVTLMLQPLPDHHSTGSDANPDNHTHIVYRRQANDDFPTPPYGLARGCNVNESIPAEDYREAKRFGKALGAMQRGEELPPGVNQSLLAGINQQYVVEAIVVGDKELLRKWNYNVNNVKYYIVTLMNIASSMYNRDKLGYDIRLILTRIAIFQSENAQRNQRLYISHNSKTTLDSFSDWQARNKPAANSRLTYDHAFLFTGYGLCFGRNEDCWELGRAWVQGMCREKLACSVNAEKGMQLGFVFAHELGHNLGISHDGTNGRCRAEDGYVMKFSTVKAQRIYLWSSCSKNYLLSYLSKGDTQCLLDKPKHFFSSFGKEYYRPPGSIYTVDQQCQFSFGSQATFCRKETRDDNVCDRLYCDDKDWPRCVTTYTGAADGTPCGDRKVCRDRRCVDKNSASVPQLPEPSMFNPRLRYNDPDGEGVKIRDDRVPGPPGTQPTRGPVDPPTPGCNRDPSRATVHGQWSGWSAPSVCSRSCGGGFQRQDRFCDRPAPQNCGQECFGDSTRFTMCNTQTCVDKTDDRLRQCQEFSSSVPKGVVLVPNYDVAEADRCKLSCKSSSNVQFTLTTSEVRNGTTCDRNTNDRCLLGKCVSVGCDNIMGSAKKRDRCEVCGGNGDNCASGVYNIKQQWQEDLCPMINATANMSLKIQLVTLKNVTVTHLVFSCNAGYSRIGPSNIACLESGRWSDTPPVCKKSNDFVFTAAFSALAAPVAALALLFLAGAVAVCSLGVSGIRSIFSPLVICFFAVSTASVLAGSLIAVNILSPFKCKTLVVDFVINLYTVVCFATFFVETVAYLVGRILSRPPIKLAITAVIVILEISIAAMSCFTFVPDAGGKESEDHCQDARTRPLLLSSYFLNAALAMGIAIVTLITYCRGLESRLKNRSVIECLTASLFAAFYIASLCSFLWAKDCRTGVHFLVVIATFPSFLTLHVFTFMARGALTRRKESADFERKPDVDLVKTSPAINYWSEDILKEINTVVISPSQIHKEKQIGRGNFGAVFKGKLKDADVALKSVLDEMNRKEINDFVREGLQMREFDHPNVMELLGICWSDDPSSSYHRSPLIILPYMELGDLKTYLRKRRAEGSMVSLTDENCPQVWKVPLEQLVKFSLHIAKGMEYISNKGVVHRDLAARNCMVNWDLKVKIGDFGLSRVMKAGKDYYRSGKCKQLPVRWMAPECLLEFVFTTKSDVWAFGVTLWEVMTLGMVPYPGVSNHEVAAFVMSGQRLGKPNECPLEVYDIMRLCWAGESDERLSFSKIIECFEDYLTELRNYLKPSDSLVDLYSHLNLSHHNLSVAKDLSVAKEALAVPQLLSKSEDKKPKEKQTSDPTSRRFLTF